MKTKRILYWSTTGIVAAVMLWSAYNFSLNAEMKTAFMHLGLPSWFRTELSVAKAVGALALLLPGVPRLLKEFSYFGFALTICSASIAHLSSGDGVLRGLEPLIFLAILASSYVLRRQLFPAPAPAATAA